MGKARDRGETFVRCFTMISAFYLLKVTENCKNSFAFLELTHKMRGKYVGKLQSFAKGSKVFLFTT